MAEIASFPRKYRQIPAFGSEKVRFRIGAYRSDRDVGLSGDPPKRQRGFYVPRQANHPLGTTVGSDGLVPGSPPDFRLVTSAWI